MKWAILVVLLLVFSAAMSAVRVWALGNGLIFRDVTLDTGATDGDDNYFKIGNDLIIIAKPGSHEHALIAPLKGKKVYFELRAE